MWGNMNESISGNAGGGFMDESTTGTGADPKKKQVNVVPLFIKHLLLSASEVVEFGTVTVRSAALLARVVDIEQTATKNTYTLEDDTGTILAMQWLEVGKDAEYPELGKNRYARVVGHLRENAGKKHLLVQKIRPMSSLNELTGHFLEVLHMFTSLRKTRGSPKLSAGLHARDSSRLKSGAARMEVEQGICDESVSGLSREQAIVFKAIQAENETDNGIERETLKSRVPPSILHHVNDIIDFLISEGHIYSTLSDDYFKTT